MTRTRTLAALTLLAALPALTPTAAVAASSWTAPAGASDTITYSNGQTDNGLFTPTAPLVGGDSFFFAPADFSATDNQTTADTAAVTVAAKPGRTLSSVAARLQGDYAVADLTTSFAFRSLAAAFGPSASITASLLLTNPTTHATLTQAFAFPVFTSDGLFDDQVVIHLPAGWSSARVALAAELTAAAPGASASTIQLKTALIDVGTTRTAAVPLPGAALAAIPGIALAYAARRRTGRA